MAETTSDAIRASRHWDKLLDKNMCKGGAGKTKRCLSNLRIACILQLMQLQELLLLLLLCTSNKTGMRRRQP